MIGMMDTASLHGFGATGVRVEVDISRGLPTFLLVGLAENSVKEARVRVQSAITNAGFEFPRSKISVNLAPADLQKNGTSFDLAIALAILIASGIVAKEKLKGIAAVGELSLTGEIRPVRGMLILAEAIKNLGFKTILVAKENAQEANLIAGLSVKIASNLGELVSAVLSDEISKLKDPDKAPFHTDHDEFSVDMSDVVGQEEARRALLIAAAGNHNLLLVGGPGTGKSMMAHRLPTILPPLSYEESLVLTKIYSVASLTVSGSLITKRPFRAPHHSSTRAGLTGGGSGNIRPGEISLACFGVLFLDELLEFPRAVLEILRQPLEEGKITLSRANQSATYPAEISFVGALNPCPCGYFGQSKQSCSCTHQAIERYQGRLSGPLIDRIDLYVSVPPVKLEKMNGHYEAESSKTMRTQVMSARSMQKARFSRDLSNGKMSRRDIKDYAQLSNNAASFLLRSSERLKISARGFDRIIRVARTIADLETSYEIHEHHIKEAFHYRPSAHLLR